jgi:hypothetical protein
MQWAYWGKVFRRAGAETVALLGLGSREQILIRVGVAAVVIVALSVFGSPDAARDEVVARAAILSFVALLLFPLVWAWKVASLPAQLDREASKTIGDLVQRLTPRFEISLPNDGKEPLSVSQGVVHQTLGGTRQTVLTSRRDLISIACRNIGETGLQGCEARLIQAWRLGEQVTVLPIHESIQLSWSSIRTTDLKVDIRPNEQKLVFVGWLHPKGAFYLQRSAPDVPIEYSQMFSESGQYVLQIQIDADNAAARPVYLLVETKEGPPLVSRQLPRVEGTITLLDQSELLQLLQGTG